jgi:hypothetical protein
VSRPIEYFDSESCTWKPATFHAWEDAPGADESKLALVELSNGEMTHVSPLSLRFTDREDHDRAAN